MATEMAHGTRARYTNLGCRCRKCQDANTAYFRARRAALRVGK